MAGTFDLKKNDKGKYMFNLKAGNGQIILTSQLYESPGTGRACTCSPCPGGPMNRLSCIGSLMACAPRTVSSRPSASG